MSMSYNIRAELWTLEGTINRARSLTRGCEREAQFWRKQEAALRPVTGGDMERKWAEAYEAQAQRYRQLHADYQRQAVAIAASAF